MKAMSVASWSLVSVILLVWLIGEVIIDFNQHSDNGVFFNHDDIWMFIIGSVTLVGAILNRSTEDIKQSKIASFLYHFAPFFYLLSIALHISAVIFFNFKYFVILIPISTLVNIFLFSYFSFKKKRYDSIYNSHNKS